MNWNRVMILGAAFLLPILVWVVIGWYAADTWQGFGVCVGSAVLGGVLLTALATQAIAQGRASGILIAAVVLLNVVLPIVALALDASPSAAAMIPPQPGVRPFTADEWRELQTMLLATPLSKNAWQVSAEQKNLWFDRKDSKPQLALNLGFMDQLEFHQTSGDTGYALFEMSINGGEWRYVFDGDHTSLWHGAHSLYLRPNQRCPARNGDEVVGLDLQLKSLPSDQCVAVRTETVIPQGSAAAWGSVPTKWYGRPLEWQLVVILNKQSGEMLDLAKLKQTPVLVGWVDSQHKKLDPTTTVLAEGPIVEFRQTSPRFAEGKIFTIRVPAELKEDIYCRVNLMVW